MTDRLKGVVVTFVADVRPVLDSHHDHMNRAMVRAQVEQTAVDAIRKAFRGEGR